MSSSQLLWIAKRCLVVSLLVIVVQVDFAFASSAVPPTADGVATRLVQQLINKDFSKAESDFDGRMKQALPPEQLEKDWAERTEHSGDSRVGEVHDVPYKEYKIVWVKTLTQKGYFWTKVVVDANQKVAGLGFAPSSVNTLGHASP